MFRYEITYRFAGKTDSKVIQADSWYWAYQLFTRDSDAEIIDISRA